MRKKPKPAKPAAKAKPGTAHAPPPAAHKKPAPKKPPPRPVPPGAGAGAPPPPGYQAPPPPPVRKKPPAKRKLALGEAVACCAAEALAASLRLTGWPVSDRDVLALYELTAGDEDEGATIEATLEAAAEHGLAGVRPAEDLITAQGGGHRAVLGVREHLAEPFAQLALDNLEPLVLSLGHGHRSRDLSVGFQGPSHVLILGLVLPDGPHAVCDDGAAWWSWGQPYDPADFPAAVIEEAWEVWWPR